MFDPVFNALCSSSLIFKLASVSVNARFFFRSLSSPVPGLHDIHNLMVIRWDIYHVTDKLQLYVFLHYDLIKGFLLVNRSMCNLLTRT